MKTEQPPKICGHSQSSFKRDSHNHKGPLQETRQILSKQSNITSKGTKKKKEQSQKWAKGIK